MTGQFNLSEFEACGLIEQMAPEGYGVHAVDLPVKLGHRLINRYSCLRASMGFIMAALRAG